MPGMAKKGEWVVIVVYKNHTEKAWAFPSQKKASEFQKAAIKKSGVKLTSIPFRFVDEDWKKGRL